MASTFTSINLRTFLQRYFNQLVLSSAWVFLCLLFYLTPMRSRLEAYFFDWRAILTADLLPPVTDVIIAEVADRTATGDLATESLNLLRRVSHSDASAIVFCLYPGLFALTADNLDQLRQVLSQDPRILVATYAFFRPFPSPQDLPNALMPLKDRLVSIATFKERSSSVLRRWPRFAYLGETLHLSLPLQITLDLSDRHFETEPKDDALVFFPRKNFSKYTSKELFQSDDYALHNLSGKIVMISPLAYPPVEYQSPEQLRANTPIRGAPDGYVRGEHLTYIAAGAISNYLHGWVLKDPPAILGILHTLIIVCLMFLLWIYRPALGPVLTICIWPLLLLIHAIIQKYLQLNLEMSDAFFLGTSVALWGASRSFARHLVTMQKEEVAAFSMEGLAAQEAQFMSALVENFSVYLQEITQWIQTHPEIKSSPHIDRLTATLRDFTDSLQGIAQLASTDQILELRRSHSKTHIHQLVKNMTGRLQVHAAEKSIQVKTAANFSPILPLFTSEVLLEAILYNLLNNAIKYSPPGSTVTIGWEKEKSDVVIWVQDEGPGIPLEEIEKIFYKFYRIEDARSFHTKGNGLGLFLSRFFARALGGNIRVLSHEGMKGSRFEIVLPLRTWFGGRP